MSRDGLASPNQISVVAESDFVSTPSDIAVTVVVCCYNAEKTVGPALESLLNQSHARLEILVIDDASTDDSLRAVQRAVRHDPRVSVLRNDTNRGIAYARMRGLREARTEFMMFFDSDDLAEPDLVASLLALIVSDERILGASCYGRYFSAEGDLGLQRIGPTTAESFFELYRRNKLMFLIPATLFRRSIALEVGGYRTGIFPGRQGLRYEDFCEDLDLWCRMSDLGARGMYFVTIPEPLLRYRKHQYSLSTKNVFLMQLKMRWIKDCLLRRRAGLPERTLAAFMGSRRMIDRFNDARSDCAAIFYKRAGFAYAARNYVALALFVSLAGLLSPKLIRQKRLTQRART